MLSDLKLQLRTVKAKKEKKKRDEKARNLQGWKKNKKTTTHKTTEGRKRTLSENTGDKKRLAEVFHVYPKPGLQTQIKFTAPYAYANTWNALITLEGA